MNSFTYCSPTKIIFGAGTAKDTGREVKAFGGKNILVFFGGGSAQQSGLLKTVTDSLDAENVKYTCVGGVQPNPLLEFAQDAVDLHKNENIDFVLAVGGGSVIDTAKAVAFGLKTPDTPLWDFICMKADIKDTLPVGVVVTIAAAGSESSNSIVLTNQETGVKRGTKSEISRPKFAIMDPVLTYTTPPAHTAAGVIDIYMHILDRYFAPDAGNDVTDGISEALMRVVIKHGKVVKDNPTNYKARAELFWAGSLAHNGLTGLGQVMDFSAHQLGAPLSAKYDTSHGMSLSATWPAWAKYVYKHDAARFAKYAREVFDININDDEKAALSGIDASVEFFRFMGCPVTISEAAPELVKEDIDELVDICTFKGARATIGVFKTLDTNDMREIYLAAL
jgi:alcohol dehydrogenase YqhD (iron-dependent ADH family)